MMLQEFIQHKGTLITEKNEGVVWGKRSRCAQGHMPTRSFQIQVLLTYLGYTYIELALG